MKTKTLSLIGLVLVIALAWPAAPSLAAKGGNHGKPGGEDPPPEPPPELPISYHPATIAVPVAAAPETDAEGNIIYPYEEYLGGLAFCNSINNDNVAVGAYLKDVYESAGSRHTDVVGCRMMPDSDGNYPIEGIQLLEGNIEWPFPGWPQLLINSRDQVAGSYYFYSAETGYVLHAAMWIDDANGDGYLDLIDLGGADESIDSTTCAFNDEGLVVVFSRALNSAYVLVPDNPDNPVTYLVCPLPEGDFGWPTAMNSSGVVLFENGVVVTPDFSDPDNPSWISGEAETVFLQALPNEDWVKATDINDLGQVVGSSGHPSGRYGSVSYAVIWENATAVPEDLGGLSDRSTDLVATAVNNVGQIIGECMEKRESATFLIHDSQMYSFEDLIGLPSSELHTWNTDSYGLVDINDNELVISVCGAICIPEYPTP